MLRFVMDHIYAEAAGGYYRQLSGVGTGYHCSSAYAEILVDNMYEKALSLTPGSQRPLTLALYVDDSHSMWRDKDHCDQFVTTLNNIWPSVRFTREEPSPGYQTGSSELSFLDILVRTVPSPTTNQYGIEWELFQKATHSGRYLHYESHCEQTIKLNIVRTEARRILNRCSTRKLAYQHLEKLRVNLANSGYPWTTISDIIVTELNKAPTPSKKKKEEKDADFILKIPFTNEAVLRRIRNIVRKSSLPIRVTTTSGTKVGSLIKRDLISNAAMKCECPIHENGSQCDKTHVVYRATCKDCNVDYIGATSRPLKERLGEHESAVRLGASLSALGEHCLSSHPEVVTKHLGTRDWDNFFGIYKIDIIRRSTDTLGTFLAESQEIARGKPRLNRKEELNSFIH